MSKEMFNPYDPKYKKVEDLPEKKQSDFRNYKDGFVGKDAFEEEYRIERVADSADHIKKSGIDINKIIKGKPKSQYSKELNQALIHNYTAMDILRERAEKEENSTTSMDAIHEEALKMNAEKFPEEIYIEKLKNNPDLLTGIPRNIWGNKKFALEAVKLNGKALRKVLNGLCNDAEVVLEAVRHDGLALQYASDKLKDNLNVVLEAVKQNTDSIKFASRNIKNQLKTFF